MGPAVIRGAILRNAKANGNAMASRPLGSNPSGDQDMATKQGKKDNRLSDKEALHIAETTDVSPGQAKELAKKHGKDKAKEEAKNFKAEG
ncbi:msr0058 [Mesorhizobium japonicum MAFF 303099]|uniref:Msr0058 protein n=2 Tax=Mesorhizobium japonicum TaxID=2066070 RepID=Q98NN6_RHILO|nr:msr0058 [Mesorhizobium japonicum MAFF 303099]